MDTKLRPVSSIVDSVGGGIEYGKLSFFQLSVHLSMSVFYQKTKRNPEKTIE